MANPNNFSYFLSTSPQCFLPSFKSTGLLVQEKKQKIDFQDGHHGGHLGYLIETILAIFDLQLQEKYLAANKRLYMAFIDLEKAFDRVPRKVIWWALRKLGVKEWIVQLVQGKKQWRRKD